MDTNTVESLKFNKLSLLCVAIYGPEYYIISAHVTRLFLNIFKFV